MKHTLLAIAVALVLLISAGLIHAEDKIDLNRATVSQLISLPGVGPALAERIVEYREKNGRFQKVEELLNVRGIGEKKFAKLEARIAVAPPAPPAQPPQPGKP